MKLSTIVGLLLGTTVAAAFALTAFAAFPKTENYSQGMFSDVTSDAWYSSEVASAYELGFMNGISDSIFSPDGTVTVAQGVTMASRVNAIYNDKTINAEASGNWYDAYVAYAKENGIIKDGQFDSYTREIKRYEMAVLFHDAMPEGYYAAINSISGVPDVSPDKDYAAKLLILYNAGIVMGSDDYGTFYPDNNIKRSESAAIINRVAIAENRIKGSLVTFKADDAYTLCYNTTFVGREGTNSGWVYDNRGGPIRKSMTDTYGTLTDISDEYGVALIREFNQINSGSVCLETTLSASGDGVYLEYSDKDQKPVYQLALLDNAWKVLAADSNYTSVMPNAVTGTSRSFKLRIIVDLNNKISTTYINDTNCGTHPLLSDNILSFRFATDEEHKTTAAPGSVNIVVNYASNDDFSLFGTDSVYGWTTSGNASAVNNELVLDKAASAQKSFASVSGKVCAETYFITPSGEDFTYSLLSGTANALTIESKDGKLVCAGNELYTLTKNMWYRLRIEADTNAGTADIKLNGRSVGMVMLENSTAINGYRVTTNTGNPKFDNMKVYALAEHPDYCPEPAVKASFDDYTVGLNVCSLWRNGTHGGWACISPYDEPKPVLGYYDEGVPETADWEIKYMVEHGIDFQAFCWYAESNSSPLKSPNNSAQLHDGYMYAKYSDYMKYCLIWEAANASHFHSEYFRTNVVPYWFENYFLDGRYLTIDNKLVLCIFGTSSLSDSSYFGSVEGAKAEFDYLRETAKSYGFDGVIVLSCGSSNDSLAAMGIDGSYAYNWGTSGNNISVNKNGILNSAKNTKMYTVPTISVGFDSIPWHGSRHGNMTVEDYRISHEWVKNEYLPQYSTPGSWNDKLVMLSTWNEYGEGTYIMPSGLNGFGYVDVIRDEYTSLPETHSDVVPAYSQKERINHLYAQYARLLRKEGWFKAETDESQLETVYTLPYTNDSVKTSNMENVTFTEEGMSGSSKAENRDPLAVSAKPLELDIDAVKTLRVTVKVPKGTNVEMFFTKEGDTSWTQNKSFAFIADSDEMKSYIVNVTNSLWSGTLVNFRIDPVSDYSTQFTVKSVEFLKKKASEEYKLFVNEIEIASAVPPESTDAGTLFPFDPTTAADYILNTFLTWRKDEGTLKLEGNHHTVIFTVGSDKYTVDGAEKPLGYTLYTTDGLPMLPFDKLAADLGYTFEKKGNDLYIKTNQYDAFNVINNRKNGAFEFNDYDTEGWKSSYMSLMVGGGAMTCSSVSESQDPTITNSPVALVADMYSAMEIKVRYKYDNSKHSKQGFCLYFLTNKDTSWNETKTVRGDLKSMDSGDEWEIYTIDLTENAAWANVITALRFDPFNAIGTMEIDYIRFIEKEGYVYVDPADIPFKIENGDAEDTESKVFYSDNGTLNIIEDPDKKGNHVFFIQGKNAKGWTYVRQNVNYKVGKTYKVECDIKIVGTAGGNDAIDGEVCCNLKYSDNGALNNFDHIIGKVKASPSDGWVHFSKEFTVNKIDSENGQQFTFYSNPVGDSSVNFLVDNITVTETDAKSE